MTVSLTQNPAVVPLNLTVVFPAGCVLVLSRNFVQYACFGLFGIIALQVHGVCGRVYLGISTVGTWGMWQDLTFFALVELCVGSSIPP